MHEDICYERPHLKEVIARIDFAGPINALEKGPPTKLVNSIVKHFPIIEPTNFIMQEVALDGASLRHSQTSMVQWNYFGKNREKQLSLSPQNIFVQYNKYNRYEDARDQFGDAVSAVQRSYPDTKAARFGLRYINQIEADLEDPTAWDEYINADLVAARKFLAAGDIASRLITVLELKYDDLDVRFQFGMPNPDYPAPIKRALYVLDLDASVSQAHDLNEALTNMDIAHKRIQDIFERSITQKLRDKMNVKSDK